MPLFCCITPANKWRAHRTKPIEMGWQTLDSESVRFNGLWGLARHSLAAGVASTPALVSALRTQIMKEGDRDVA